MATLRPDGSNPICYDCGADMELKTGKAFFSCPNCGLDLETEWLKAEFNLAEFNAKRIL